MDQTPQTEAMRRADGRQSVRQPGKRRRWRLIAGIAGLAAGGVVAWGVMDRQNNLSQLTITANQQALPKVALVSPEPGPKTRELTLPGDVHPWYEARMYAQVSGYVTAWYKDYGAPVRKSELLATISTPDLDEQLEQARAQLEVAERKYAVAKVTAERWQSLRSTAAVSQETVDEKVADAKAEEATVQAAKYNVARYEAKEAFKQVVAPFDGIVTARDTNVGDYVEATGGNAERGVTRELFTVADIDKLRIYVSVPQDYAEYIKPGLTATMTLPQFPSLTFHVELVTTAQSFNMTSRTVLVELTMDNPEHKVWPGAYAEVQFELPTQPGVLIIPEQSLLFRANGLQVALVKDGMVHLQNVKLGLNLGQKVQVIEGLTPSDRLIANPSEGLLDHQPVQVVDAPLQNSDLSDKLDGSGEPVSAERGLGWGSRNGRHRTGPATHQHPSRS
jgi:membrane fusion protein, multidrug efflux system